MAIILRAHGHDPGPTQRPYLTGAISSVLATAPAIAILWLFGSLRVEARILGVSTFATLAVGWVVMAAAGAAYARLFGRTANARRGGWLFGAAFGFALWAAGAVIVLPIVSGGVAPAGQAALGVFLSFIVWGLSVGILVSILARHLRLAIDSGSELRQMGPTVASADNPPPAGRSSRSKQKR